MLKVVVMNLALIPVYHNLMRYHKAICAFCPLLQLFMSDLSNKIGLQIVQNVAALLVNSNPCSNSPTDPFRRPGPMTNVFHNPTRYCLS